MQHKWFLIVLAAMVGIQSSLGTELPSHGHSGSRRSYVPRVEGRPVCQSAVLFARVGNPIRPAFGHWKPQVLDTHTLQTGCNQGLSLPSPIASFWECQRSPTLYASQVKLQI